MNVAPVRERGLKSRLKNLKSRNMRRSREGAWIEIDLRLLRSYGRMVAPVRERGLKYDINHAKGNIYQVAPVRERGLKF